MYNRKLPLQYEGPLDNFLYKITTPFVENIGNNYSPHLFTTFSFISGLYSV